MDLDNDDVDEYEDLVEEGVACLHLDDNSDVEKQFVLSVDTCLPEEIACAEDEFHLN